MACPDWITNDRYTVERLRARLKAWRFVAIHYAEPVSGFMGVLSLAASLNRLKRCQTLGGSLRRC